jgi:16S rRNA (cytosine967-C5)-methyltransferase
MPQVRSQKSKSNPRRVAARVVAKVLEQSSFSNLALSQAMDEAGLSPLDKSLCTELTYGTIRWASSLEQSLRRALEKPNQKIDTNLLPHLLIAAYQLQHLNEKIPAYAAVNAAVNEVKRKRPYLAGFTNLILRRLGSPMHLMLQPEDKINVEKLSQAFGLPLTLVQAISETLPIAEWHSACEAMNQRPKIWLRMFQENPHLLLGEQHAFVPLAVCVQKAGTPTEISGFQNGDFMVQDPASQTAALLVNPSRTVPSTIIDCCAAPGSKSIILKKVAEPKSHIFAVDVNDAKIRRIQTNARRMKLSIKTLVKDGRTLANDPRFQEQADAILLDAPCSGLGTIRRHPEIKLKHTAESLEKLLVLQGELLDSAAKTLKTQGILVYSVCSPMPQEGSKQITAFLTKHPNFSREDPALSLPWLPANAINEQHEIRLWPHRHDCDAFFAVRLKKIAPSI